MFVHEMHPASYLRIRTECEEAFKICTRAMAKERAVETPVELTLKKE
jgi:hypothetical protein